VQVGGDPLALVEHGQPVLFGQGFVFEGVQHQSYSVSYTRRDDCPNHEHYDPIEILPWRSDQARVGDLLDRARSDLDPSAIVEFNQDLLESLHCPKCNRDEPLLLALGQVKRAIAICPTYKGDRTPRMFHTIGDNRRLLDLPLSKLGIPRWDIIGARSGGTQKFYEMQGDRAEVLGPLST